MVKIYVDADACPVKGEVERIALRHKIETFFVCNGGLRPPRNSLVKLVIVNQESNAADDWIVEHIEKTDICITNDIPLAKNCLEKGAVAIRPNGNIYTEDNIGMAVATREIMEKLRESGKTLDGPPPFSRHDRSKFLDKMNIIVEKSKFL